MSDEVLGDLNAACARDNDKTTKQIAELVGLTPRTVQKRLYEAHDETLVRHTFADVWPMTAGTLAKMHVKQAREAGLFAEITRVTGLTERTVRRCLEEAHGKGFLQNLFSNAWPNEESEDEAPVSDEGADDGLFAIGNLTVARARRDEQDEDDDDKENLAARFRLDPHRAWSRPRQLARVLRLLGIQVPQRLHAQRFRKALQLLARAGIDACLASDEERTVLPLDADTPSIHAEIRLRIATEPAPRTPPLARRPETSPPPPIVVVSRPARPAPPPPLQPREPAYDTALRRLQFLTAVPSIDRQYEPEWPNAYLEAAIAGLEVTPFEVRHLRMVAASLVKGHHNPEGIITRLLKVETPRDLEALVARFRHLNDSMPENAEEVIQWMGAISAGYPLVAHSQPHAPGPARAPVASAASPPAPRSPKPAPTVKLAAHETHTNVRDLGALDDMFKD